jgi:RNA polymerase sigma-70 factor (ECF subfamily)
MAPRLHPDPPAVATPDAGRSEEQAALRRLIDRARSADTPIAERHAAFVGLVERFQDAAYGYAYSLLGDPHLAQDATQEAFAAAYRQIGELREPAAFALWLRRIVRTHCARLRRGHTPLAASLERLRAGAEGGAEVADPDDASDPAAAAEARELHDAVAAALRGLPAHERAVTVLFYICDYPQEEIAEFLGVPLTTVKKRLQSARGRLERRMLTMLDDALREHAHRFLPSHDGRLVESLRFPAAFDAAAAEGELPLVELLLVDGLDVDAADAGGRTLLSLAAQRGNLDAVEFLLRHGADVNARDAGGVTPLGWAERAGHRTVAALLRRRGAAT